MYKLTKRIIDILISLTVLILFSPFLIPIVIILKLSAEGEIFYQQQRIGFKNSNFNILKFATMLKNSPNMGTGSITLRNDPRVTTIGKYLRITKINELPQIINVLRGDMTIVGPRPQMKVDFLAYPKHIQKVIYNTPPGITGIGSIIFRDEESLLSNTDMEPKEYYKKVIAPYKGNLELWYLENMSLFVDVKIILLTALKILNLESIDINKWLKNLPEPAAELKSNI